MPSATSEGFKEKNFPWERWDTRGFWCRTRMHFRSTRQLRIFEGSTRALTKQTGTTVAFPSSATLDGHAKRPLRRSTHGCTLTHITGSPGSILHVKEDTSSLESPRAFRTACTASFRCFFRGKTSVRTILTGVCRVLLHSTALPTISPPKNSSRMKGAEGCCCRRTANRDRPKRWCPLPTIYSAFSSLVH